MLYMKRSDRIDIALRMATILKSKELSKKELMSYFSAPKQTVGIIIRKLMHHEIITSANEKLVLNKQPSEDDIKEAFGYGVVNKTKMVECSICEEPQVRILKSTLKPLYLDEEGRKWAGKKCPDCVEEELSASDMPIDPLTSRKCRKCSCQLTASRYFLCYTCKPDMPLDEEDLIYHGEAIEEEDISDMQEIELMGRR